MLIRLLKDKLEALRAEKRYRTTDADWAEMRRTIQPRRMADGTPKRLIIVPCDPWTLIGSKGDEAMIEAVVSQVKSASPELKVGMITGSDAASEVARELGYEPIQVWRHPLKHVVQTIIDFKADGLAVLGADCMDGYYSADTTLCLLALADIAARLGIRTTILGFSFNDQPNKRLSSAFNTISDRVSVNVRDAVSLGRLKSFSTVQAQLVADAAFMLAPINDSSVVRAAIDWADSQRNEGKKVIGFNVHPMLIKSPTSEQLSSLVTTVTTALSRFMSGTDASIALISHDYRGSSGDDVCLKPIAEHLKASFGERVFYSESKCSAAELKGIAGAMDGVITGRMHLAIASLGMSVPVAALTYQGKFQGLMQHFKLSEDLLLPPKELSTPEPLCALMKSFSAEIEAHRKQVTEMLPAVKKMSADNVGALLK